MPFLTPKQLSDIYAILYGLCGASGHDRDHFIQRHMEPSPPQEWRFQGLLGFGGKLLRANNGRDVCVTCYREDETPRLLEIIERANALLAKVVAGEAIDLPVKPLYDADDLFLPPAPEGYTTIHATTPLPNGAKVIIPRGTLIRTPTAPTAKARTTKRTTHIVTVGTSSEHTPEVCWAGTGGYWQYAKKTRVFVEAAALKP